MSRQSQQEKKNQNVFAAATLLTFLFLPPSFSSPNGFGMNGVGRRKTEGSGGEEKKRFPPPIQACLCRRCFVLPRFSLPSPSIQTLPLQRLSPAVVEGTKRAKSPPSRSWVESSPDRLSTPQRYSEQTRVVPGGPDSSFLSRCSSACLHCRPPLAAAAAN